MLIPRRGAILYSRVSTKKQAHSIGFQEHFLTKFAIYRGFNIVNKYSDIGSGTDITKLTNLQMLVKEIQPQQFILVRDVSRLGRNRTQIINMTKVLQENQNCVYSVNDAVDSGGVGFVKAVELAEYELKNQKRAQASAIQTIKDCGGFLGRPPYGYTIVKRNGIPQLTTVDSEISLINTIVYWYQREGKDVDSILRLLKNSGNKKRGHEWTRYGIQKIITSNIQRGN